MSTIIKGEMAKRGIEINNSTIEDFANKMKAEGGKDVFAVMMGEKLKEAADSRNILVVGFRSVAEFETVERTLGFDIPLIELLAPQKLRFERLSERSTLPIQSIDVLLMRDRSNIRMGILELFEHADYVVSNTGSKDELKESIEELILKLGEKE